MLTNEINNGLITGINTLVNNAIKQLRLDKTVTASITSIVDIVNGEYKVSYEGNVFSAFALNGQEYKVDDMVYVKIPENDWSSKKYITGVSARKSLSAAQITALDNEYIEVSPSWDSFFRYNPSAELRVCCGSGITDSLTFGDSPLLDEFNIYHSNYEYAKIRAEFLTQFYKQPTGGKYGLKFTFEIKGSNKTVDFIFDSTQFLGNIYNFSSWADQEIVIQLQKDYFSRLVSITLFEDFDEYDENSKGRVTDYNIFCRNINITFVSKNEYKNDTYYLLIQQPDGIVFKQNAIDTESLTLTPYLRYNNQQLLTKQNSKCLWFIEDASITKTSEGYRKDIGVGWRLIAQYDGPQSYEVQAADVQTTRRFKLYVLYNEKSVFQTTITIYRLGAPKYYIEQSAKATSVVLTLKGDAGLNLVGDWYQLNPDGDYILRAQQANNIEIADYLTYSDLTFKCNVFNVINNIAKPLGVLEYSIVNTKPEDGLVIRYTGPDTFNYDANGDISIEMSEVIHTIHYELIWPKGESTALSAIEWTLPTGNTMLENPTADSDEQILTFSIKPKFRQNYTNNTFKVKITTLDGKEYEYEKEITFTKDGEQGTNGTSYAVVIRPCDANGNKLTNYWYLAPKTAKKTINLKAYVYKDGEEIDAYSYSWNKSSDKLGLRANGATAVLSAPDDLPLNAGYSVTVNVAVKDPEGQTTKVHYTLPVHIANVDKDIKEHIPNFVQYNMPGYTPSYDTRALELLVDGERVGTTFTSLTPSLLEIQNNKIKPISNYVYEEESIAVIKCVTNGIELYHSIIYYLNLYGNSIINGWNHKEISIDKENGYILAPIIGAGTKDTENAFTGILMGNDSQQKLIGLYGYNGGINSFGLLENGNAYFGPNKEIYFDVEDPENPEAHIAGWDIGTDRLSAPGSNTILYANGQIDCDELYANSGGSIGGWEITSDGLEGGNTILNKDGTITCENLIANTSGTIGGWTIGNGQLSSGNMTLIGGSNPQIQIAGSYNTTISNNGKIETNQLVANGGTIGGWTITSDKLGNNDTYLTASGKIACDVIIAGQIYLKSYSDGAELGTQLDAVIRNLADRIGQLETAGYATQQWVEDYVDSKSDSGSDPV